MKTSFHPSGLIEIPTDKGTLVLTDEEYAKATKRGASVTHNRQLNSLKKQTFNPNRKFRREYDRIFKTDPAAANLFLLLAELADEYGQVVTDELEITRLMAARFEDPRRYTL